MFYWLWYIQWKSMGSKTALDSIDLFNLKIFFKISPFVFNIRKSCKNLVDARIFNSWVKYPFKEQSLYYEDALNIAYIRNQPYQTRFVSERYILLKVQTIILWELDCFMHLWNFSFETERKLTATASTIQRGMWTQMTFLYKVSFKLWLSFLHFSHSLMSKVIFQTRNYGTPQYSSYKMHKY